MFNMSQFTGFGSRKPLCKEVLSWISRMKAGGYSASPRAIIATDAFIEDARQAGILSKFYRVNLFCGTTLAASMYPIINSSGSATDTNVNFVAADYSETTGLKGNGSTKYLQTGMSPSGSLNVDSVHMSSYVTVFGTNAGFDIGSEILSPNNVQCRIAGHYNSSGTQYELGYVGDNNGGANPQFLIQFTPPTRTTGFFLFTRSAINNCILYDEGGVKLTNTTTRTGLTLTSCPPNLVIAANNNNGTIQEYSNHTYGAYTIGSGMSTNDANNLRRIMFNFQKTLNRAA